MSLATRVQWYLNSHDIDYEIVHHPHSSSSLDSGAKAHLPAGRIAKCVLLEDERGYVLAVLPAACRLSLDAIEGLLHRRLALASEAELGELFEDCEVGAVPAVGAAYNVPMLIDDCLLRLPDLYFEGGDHEDLVHLDAPAFQKMVRGAPHGCIRYTN